MGANTMKNRHQARMQHALALAALAALSPAQAVTYTLLDLGQVFGQATAARAINNLGQVVGDTALSHSWIWSADSGLQIITPLNPVAVVSGAYGINDTGRVAGNYNAAGLSLAYGWSGGPAAQTLPLDARNADARGINATGRIVGTRSANFAGAPDLAYVYDGAGGVATLGTLGGRYSSGRAINDRGQAVGAAETSGLDSHAFVWTPGLGMVDVNPADARSSTSQAINNRGQVAGMAYDADGRGRAFVWSPDSGAQRLGTLARDSRATGINDSGQVVGWADANSTGTPVGAFLWSPRGGMLDLNSQLSTPPAARVAYAAAINASGQIVGQDENLHAVLLTPSGELAWQGVSGGDFGDGRNWEMNFAPSRFLDAQLVTPGTQLVTLAQDSSVNSLGLGAASGGRPTLRLLDGASLSATYGVTVRATGTLTGDGQVQGAVVNLGTVLGNNLRITGGLQNQGLISMQGGTPGLLQAELLNQPGGQLRLAAAERLQLLGSAHRNEGTIELRGGELEINGALDNAAGARVLMGQGGVLRLNQGLSNAGQLNVGFGGAEVFGTVLNESGGQIVLSGNSSSTFYDAVTVESGGELRVSAGSTALFFGLVRQASGALFTGTGTKFYEGRLFIGQSPGLGVDEGSVSFGGGSEYQAELGGLEAGSGFDKFIVGGELHFGGTLKLQSWAGFVPQAGQRYDLFDWGSSSGRFDRIDASGLRLGEGLMLDTSQLYVDGSIAVTAVPEPASWALMGLGAVWLLRRVRPVPGGNGAARC